MIPKDNRNHQTPRERYDTELEKCIKQDVNVETQAGKKFKGKLIAYNPIHLNVVILTEKKKIIIRNVSHIERNRDTSWDTSKPIKKKSARKK